VAGGSAGSEGAGEAVRRELDVMLHLRGQRHVVQVVDSFEDNAYGVRARVGRGGGGLLCQTFFFARQPKPNPPTTHPTRHHRHRNNHNHNTVHMIMELCEGGDLVHRITTRGSYTERDAAQVTRTLLEVLAYAHDMGVVHRDIKPDNCLMMSDADDALLKLADWGFACFYNGRRKLRGVAGTCYYIAPEVVMGEYDEKVDIWSAGVMLYVLLCGAPPFYAVRDDDVFRRVVDDGVPPM
jgi:serine/threonine protein kinase